MRKFPPTDMFLRRRVVHRALAIVGLLFVSAGKVWAPLVSQLHVPRLTERAELVVRGKVVSVDKPKGEQVKSVVLIDAIAKGDFPKSQLEITYPAPPPMNYTDSLTVGDYGLFFVIRNGGGAVPVDIQNIKMSVREGRPISETKEQDALQFVYEEVLFTAAGPSVFSKEDEITRTWSQKEKLKSTVTLASGRSYSYFGGYKAVPMNIRALKQLTIFPDNVRTRDLLFKLLSSPESDLRIAAATSLLRFNDLRGLKIVADFLNSPEYEKPLSSWQHDIAMDASRAIGRLENVDATDVLGDLLKNKHSEVRQSAVSALRNMSQTFREPPAGIKELSKGVTIPFLVHALDDADVEVRFHAVAGLAEITQKLSWYPRHGYWEKEFDPAIERQTIAYWKQWWENEGKKAFEPKS